MFRVARNFQDLLGPNEPLVRSGTTASMSIRADLAAAPTGRRRGLPWVAWVENADSAVTRHWVTDQQFVSATSRRRKTGPVLSTPSSPPPVTDRAARPPVRAVPTTYA